MLNDVEWASKSLILIRCNCSWLATGSGFGVWCHQWYGMVVTVRTPHGTPTALNCSLPGWNTIVKFCGFFGGTERGSPWITGVGPMWLCNLLTSGATVTRLWLDLSLYILSILPHFKNHVYNWLQATSRISVAATALRFYAYFQEAVHENPKDWPAGGQSHGSGILMDSVSESIGVHRRNPEKATKQHVTSC